MIIFLGEFHVTRKKSKNKHMKSVFKNISSISILIP